MVNKSFRHQTILLLALTSGVAQAQLTSEAIITAPAKEFPGQSGWESEFVYIQDSFSIQRGKTASASIGSLDAYLNNDFRKKTSLKGDFQMHFVHVQGSNPSDLAGDTQYFSNIAMPQQTDRLSDFWYQQDLSKSARLLLGLHDFSTEFGLTDSSYNFVNSSFTASSEISWSGKNGASIWPITSAAVRLDVDLSDKVYLKVAAYDGNPGDASTYQHLFSSEIREDEGALMMSEAAYYDDKSKIALGAWGYTQKLETLSSAHQKQTSGGGYLIIDHHFNERIGAFLRAGAANANVNIIQDSLAFGSVIKGIFDKNHEDEIGYGLTDVHFARGYSGEANARETAYELYYQFMAMKTVAIRPDIQYIKNPSGASDAKDAQAYGLRMVVEL